MSDWDATAALAGSDYAQRSREMINLVKDLRALGADAEIDLPRIAVIGNQSAGKSSLVEAIADVRLRRSPVGFEKNSAGNQLTNVREHNKNELEDMLRRAQIAVLNPSTPAAHFATADLSFSPNVVCVDVSGPMSRIYHDIQNQSAALLAKEVDPQGLRTVGVLTKPDTLQPGEESDWLDILHDRKHRLHHGYFREAITSPILALENVLQTTKSRVGVPHLTSHLSKLLTDRISEALPILRTRSLASLHQARDDLRSLPDPPSDNILSDLLRLISQFEKTISDCVGGSIHEPSVMQYCRATYDSFRERIKATTPDFTVNDDNSDSSLERPRSTKDVQAFIKSHITRELPFDVPFDAKAHLISQCLADWPHFVETCADDIFLRLGELLDVKIEQTFGRFAILKESVSNVLNKLLNEIQENAAKHLEWLLALEHHPFTLNTHYLESYREKYLKKFQEEKTSDEPDQPADAASPEIVLMAEVRAYFQVAYKRIIDNVPRAIDYDGLMALSTRVNEALVCGLGVDAEGSSSRLKEYFAEAPDVTDLRAELQAKQKRLEEITTRLNAFSRKSDAGRVLNTSSPLSPFRAMNPPNSRPVSQITADVRTDGSDTEEKDNPPSPQSTVVSPEPHIPSRKSSIAPRRNPENFDTVSDRIVAWANSPEEVGGAPVLSAIVSAVVRKCLSAGWVPMGADICQKLEKDVRSHVKGRAEADHPVECGGVLACSYALRDFKVLLRGEFLKSTVTNTIQERKAYDLKIAIFLKEMIRVGVISNLGMLKYVEDKFNDRSSPERHLELSYTILKVCGPLWNDKFLQDIFTAIEQRMEDVSPHLKLMFQELIDLRERGWHR
ncbi:hypothetical protein CPB85DRAFT_1332852 [Mucidula mucida]|nr:hypothetical protein CPB85DRAFT_1332852 [Mucidula mucida]